MARSRPVLFNSYLFVCCFLPLVLVGFVALRRIGPAPAVAWLTLASLVFYGWWNPAYLALLGGSLVANWFFGLGHRAAHARLGRGSRVWLAITVIANLALLGWFKYANFLVDSVDYAAGGNFLSLDKIALPLAISFFTFQQIAFQVDAYYGLVKRHSVLDYACFVTFFPQLIAGPIVHHGTVLPQLRGDGFRCTGENLLVGQTLFIMGLAKKVLIADNLALLVAPTFAAAADGAQPEPVAAIGALLAYTLQIYFDFSGYSDMAVGLARMFGIRLPQNFDSPLRAASIIEFWNRWHMTLSAFLRDYLFFPLAGRKPGPIRRNGALLATMVLGGLWHGAAWTFVAWGALHGLYLVINHAWRGFRRDRGWSEPGALGTAAGVALTFVCFALSLAFFRADSFEAAGRMLAGCFGLVGESATVATFVGTGWWQVAVALLLAWAAPNVYQMMADYRPTAERRWRPTRLQWRPTWHWCLPMALLALYTLTQLANVSEFIYWNF